MMTFVNIHDVFKDIASRHLQINSFGFGQIHEIATSGTINYPMMFAQPNGSTVRSGEIGYRYSILIMDLLSKGKQDEVDVLSDTYRISLDVLAEIRIGGQSFDSDYGFELRKNEVTMTDFIERFDDEVGGWQMDVILWTDWNWDRCSAVFEGQAAGSNPSGTTVSGIVGGRVRVSSDDTTLDFLRAKLTQGTGITLTVLNDGANETVQISSSAAEVDTYESGITAFASGGQASATELTEDINRIDTVAATDASVKPNVTATPGFKQTAQNRGLNNMNYYPFLGNNFEGLAANAPVSIAPGNQVTVFCYTSGELTFV